MRPQPASELISELVDESTAVSESTLRHKPKPERELDPQVQFKEDTIKENQNISSKKTKHGETL